MVADTIEMLGRYIDDIRVERSWKILDRDCSLG